MSVGEENASRRKTINVWRQRLRVPAKTTDPTIEVINGDEEDVRLRRALRLGR